MNPWVGRNAWQLRILRPTAGRGEANQDVALVMGVDQGLARQLHGDGIKTVQALATLLGYVQRLSDLKRPWGAGMRKVGTSAARILLNAEVLTTRQ